MPQPVTTYYLEMHTPQALRFKNHDDADFTVSECRIKQYPFNRFLYEYVGAPWQWTDKDGWSDAAWKNYAEDPDLRTWVAYKQGCPAGYYELQYQPQDNVEIRYFGLAGVFIGQGYGAYLLSHAIRSAWDWGAQRVWVHTCSLDHPGALANYQARGLQLYRQETATIAPRDNHND